MKIALAPDLHCFYTTYGHLGKDGKNFRETEWQKIADAFAKECIARKADAAVIPGDLFTNPRPSANQILMVASLFQKLEDGGVKVLGISGNHDVGISGGVTSNDVVGAIGGDNKWCVQSFDSCIVDGVGFGFLPFQRDASVIAYNPDYAELEMSERLVRIAGELSRKLESEGAEKRILVGHYSISGSVSSSGQSMESGSGEVVLPLGELLNEGWDACLFGHIHKPQILSEKPFVAYSGCFQRINIGERDDDRGFFLYDTDTGKHKFVSLPAIKMQAFIEDVASKEDAERLLKDISDAKLQGKIVQVRYSISKKDIALVDRNEIIDILKKKRPIAVAGVGPHITEVARQRDVSLTESLDARTALSKWMENKEIDDDRKKKVFALFDGIRGKMERAARGG